MAHLVLLGIVYISFISLGLPDGILGVAWPAIRADMGQPLAAVGMITITMTVCSATSSFFAGAIVKRIGTGAVVATSCLMTALALVGFSYAPSFLWLVALGVPLGLGAGAVDASLNHFVAAHYSSRHMNWLHGFWGVGATTGPLIMGLALASRGGWESGARAIGFVQLTLAVVLWLTLSLWSQEHSKPPAEEGEHGKPTTFKPLRTRALWLAPLCFLLYVAAEMGTGLWAASILVGSRGMSPVNAGLWVSVYFGSITAGRFGVGLVANRLGNRRLIRLGIAVATVGALVFASHSLLGTASLAGLVLMGLGCAPVFPSMMHETVRRFPDDVARTVIGRQMTFAYIGGSVVPAAFGLLATWAGLAAVMPVVVVVLITMLALTATLDRLT
ncbi:MFS transporter [Rhodoferax saidenbachensis]|uniref:Fucose permease n=1 Tax=Rhodoferax saidenbachensis TaxID=1484693 RepID=A0ABU1ZNP3_9BURK|nr:MFS transporter [Rhodoferax saidenbachensis]MDR7306566.1 fucose permease [Rhodoferax saidenbachensis]